MRTDIAEPVRLADYRVSDYLIDAVELDVALHATTTRVRATLRIRPNPDGRPGLPLLLDGDELVLRELRLDGMEVEPGTAVVTPDQLVLHEPPARAFVLEITTELNPSANTRLMGLYRSGSAYCTQCEAEGFRRITYFLDRPDVLSIYTVRIEADRAEAPVLLSNGNRIDEGALDSGRHYALWHDPFPKPSYLFALVGGDLGSIHDTFTTRSGRDVTLGIYVEPGKEANAAYAMDALKRSMAWDETAFGREYDLDLFNIVAVSDFNMGAMENKGLNVFNDKYVLASPQTATDGDYAGIETVIAHEYFHNWTGNRITCRDWFQLCLKEGLTVFRDHEFSADMRSRPVRRIADVRTLRAQQFPEDAGPLAHNVRPETYLEINNFYTATIYEKGAEIIRMLKVLIGDDTFRAGMDLYFDRWDGTATTIEAFVACFAEVSGRDLGAFSRWYAQAGTPLLEAEANYDAAARTFTLDLRQSCPATPGQSTKAPFVIPIALGLVGDAGRALTLTTGSADGCSARELERGVVELDTSHRRIMFTDVPERPVASLLRGFSAPVRLSYSASEPDLIRLIRFDCDSFNRWQAAQTYATRLLLRSTATVKLGGAPIIDTAFIDALGEILSVSDADPAFAAQMMSLPSEADIAREMGEDVDPDAIHDARETLRRAIGQHLAASLRAIYERSTSHGAYSPDAASAGRRALRNLALDLYAAGRPEEGSALAAQQVVNADTMTDEIGALATLSLIAGEKREAALTAFYDKHASEALVIDKWFALQAAIPEPETIARMLRLMNHPSFSMTNPNRVRSLIGAFAGSNQTQFNAADGSGYSLLVDIVIALDPKNPQVAARLLSAFRTWRMLEPGRRQKAEAALRRVAEVTHLSADVRDIAGRSLA
jgi:aminopeptidase N